MLSETVEFLEFEPLEMEQDLKKALKDLTDAVTALVNHTTARPIEQMPVLPQSRVAQWFSTWQATVICLVALLGGFWGILQYTISSELSKAFSDPNQKITKLAADAESLRRDVDLLRNQAAAAINHQAEDISKLPVHALLKSLPTVRNIIAAAQDQKVKVDPEIIATTGGKLLSISERAPEVWPIVGELISYRSQMLANWEQVNLPLCTQQPLTFDAQIKPGSKDLKHGPIEFKSCKIILDSAEATAILSHALSIASVVLDHCAIFYTGGPIVLYPVKIARDSPPRLVGEITFEHCFFVVSLPGIPSPVGQRLSKTLLTARSDTIKFDANGTTGL